jgi:hypothetical protein
MSIPILLLLGLVIIVAFIALKAWTSARQLKRAEFIRTYRWPPGLLDKLEKHHDGFARKQSALVSQGLRQFFLAYLEGGLKYVAMPSQAADDLWHEFILYTREYRDFCDKAFGTFLHHSPAVVLKPDQKKDNTGLRRVWWQCCKQENIDPAKPSRLPLLFALDTKLKLANGYHYTPDCAQLRRNGNSGSQCGGEFSSSSVDGSTEGYGETSSSSSDSASSGDSGGGGDSSGGGGCGGGD